MSMRRTAAIAVCKAAYKAMRLMGRNGRALPGMIAMKLDGDIIRELSAGCKTIVITGTNGKTTTTHMVQQAIINVHGRAAYDPSSTNLEQGIATTLCLDSTVSGRRRSEWAVIESDEGATKTFLPAMHPQVLVVTNLYRDQVDRYPTWTTARDYIIEAVRSSPDTVLVLDADCQVTASIADAVPNDVIWFGVECEPYDEGIADFDEKVECVECGADLGFSHRTFAHLGNYSCPACGRAHHEPDIAVVGVKDKREKSCTLTLRVRGRLLDVPANVRAGYDIYNAAAAFAGLDALGLPHDDIARALGHFQHAAHRFEVFDVEGARVRLLLMKNTAGANQLVNMLATEKDLPASFAFLLGNEIMDGTSTEWIEGVRWEKLVGPETRAIIGGPCHADMRARIVRAGADEANLHVQPDYAELVREMATAGEDMTVIANCSTIEALRVELVKKYRPMDYWAE